MKRILIALALLLLPAIAHAQCNGVFANNTVCGNVTGSSNLPRATSPSAFLGAAGGSNGQIQYNNASTLGGFTAGGDLTFSVPNFTIAPNAVTNGKINPGAANTLKGSVNGTTTTDLSAPSCSTSRSALQWLTNTGLQCTTLGDVVGPASATDNSAVRFDSTTGKLVQDSALSIADTTGSLSRVGNGGIPVQGTNTNDSAAAGFMGEYGEATLTLASSISLTTNTAADVITVSLAAGDYDVWGIVVFQFNGATVTSQVAGYINQTANTFPSNDSGAIGAVAFGAGKTGGSADFITTPSVRQSLSGTTTVRLGARAVFTTNTATAAGTIKWRRRR